MCTVHLLFGNSEDDRRPELLQLDDVYRTFRDAGTEKDIIICGDFNFGPDDVGWAELKAEDDMQFAIKPPGKTTIADVSLYDNCWWPGATTEIVVDSGHIFAFDEVMYPVGSRKEANRLTSDHRPISVRVRIGDGDDD
jgi:endonuclease/exonuclease/phosphatase family metal-dependent hydrolase